MALKPVLQEVKDKLRAIAAERNLGEDVVQVTVGTLSVEQAIGNPNRRDFPIIEGREVMIEAQFHDSFGQAFTDRPHDFSGSLNNVLNLDLESIGERAVFIATLNAVMSHLGIATKVRHCRNEEPEECAAEIARQLQADLGKLKIGLIGLQPAILENLVKTFGAENVRCTDLNPKNIGSKKYGAEIWDGKSATGELITWCDLVLATSSTLVNNTFDYIRDETVSQDKQLIIFGVTGAGVASLLGLERLCFKSR